MLSIDTVPRKLHLLDEHEFAAVYRKNYRPLLGYALRRSWEGLGNAEIAKVLSCSRYAVSIRLHRARRRFARVLRAAGIDQERAVHARRRSPVTASKVDELVAGLARVRDDQTPGPSTAPITAPGEMLNGVDLTHRTVARLRALLAGRHITIAEYRWENDPNAGHDALGGVQVRTLRADQVPGSWHVLHVDPLSEKAVVVAVDPEQWPH